MEINKILDQIQALSPESDPDFPEPTFMTPGRLFEAIQEHDPDGEGLFRVLAFSRRNSLLPRSPTRCLLAIAWAHNLEAEEVIVAKSHYYRFQESLAPFYQEHGCRDIVVWSQNYDYSEFEAFQQFNRDVSWMLTPTPGESDAAVYRFLRETLQARGESHRDPLEFLEEQVQRISIELDRLTQE